MSAKSSITLGAAQGKVFLNMKGGDFQATKTDRSNKRFDQINPPEYMVKFRFGSTGNKFILLDLTAVRPQFDYCLKAV